MTSRAGAPVAEDRERAAAAQAEKLAALHARLTEQIARLTTGAEWKAWLEVAARFHDYSFNNVLLVLAQRPDATRIAGYRAWQSMGRQVDKGQRGIQILAPVTRRVDPDRDAESEAPAVGDAVDAPTAPPGRRLVGWRVAHVWDISQTSGAPLPEHPQARLLAGGAPERLWSGLQAQVEVAGFAVQRGDCRGANGYTNFADRVVRVRDDVDDAQAVKTLVHELAHVLLHDPGRRETTTRGCRGTGEVEAESVAYLVCTHAGIATDDYTFPYVAGWAGRIDRADTGAVVAATGRRVLATAGRIVDQLHDTAAGGPVHNGALVRSERATPRPGGRLRNDSMPRPSQIEPSAGRLLEAHTAAAAWYRDQLLGLVGAGPRRYLDQRALGFLSDPEDPWQVGYAPARWCGLTEHLRATGFTDGELQLAGLASRSTRGTLIDRFRDRIMLPIRSEDGHVVAFIGRAPEHHDDRTPKYLNSPATPIYRKGDHLFGAGVQPLRDRRVVLVEGPLDVLAVHAVLPAVAAVAPCGTAFTQAQARLLSRAKVRDVVVAFDADDAGTAAAARAYHSLRTCIPAALVARLPAGADPASLAETRPAELVDALATPARLAPLADAVVDQTLHQWRGTLVTVEGRVAATRALAQVIAGLSANDVARQVGRASLAIGVPVGTVTCTLSDYVAPDEAHASRTGRELVALRDGPSTSSGVTLERSFRPVMPIRPADRSLGTSIRRSGGSPR